MVVSARANAVAQHGGMQVGMRLENPEEYLKRVGINYNRGDPSQPPRRQVPVVIDAGRGRRKFTRSAQPYDAARVFQLCHGGLDAATRGQYDSWIRLLQLYKCEISLRGIVRLLSDDLIVEVFSEGTIKGMTRAVKHCLRSLGEPVQQEDLDLLNNVTRGYLALHPGTSVPAAALEPRQYCELVTEIAKRREAQTSAAKKADYDSLARGVLLQYAFALRISQVRKLRRQHLVIEEGGAVVYVGNRLKVRTSATEAAQERHDILPQLANRVKDMLRSRDWGRDELLAPYYPIEKMNQLLREVAEKCKWPGFAEGKLRYASHVMRHGATALAYRTHGAAAAQRTVGHLDGRMTEHYRRDNATRLGTKTTSAIAPKRRGRPPLPRQPVGAPPATVAVAVATTTGPVAVAPAAAAGPAASARKRSKTALAATPVVNVVAAPVKRQLVQKNLFGAVVDFSTARQPKKPKPRNAHEL